MADRLVGGSRVPKPETGYLPVPMFPVLAMMNNGAHSSLHRALQLLPLQ